MDLKKIAERVASKTSPGHNGIYVDWEGRGYGPDHMRADIDLMKEFLGDGLVYEGAVGDFEGHFFNNKPDLGPAVTTIRGGRTYYNEEFLEGLKASLEASPAKMRQHASWEDLVKALQLSVD